jgi:hypothetical protein
LVLRLGGELSYLGFGFAEKTVGISTKEPFFHFALKLQRLKMLLIRYVVVLLLKRPDLENALFEVRIYELTGGLRIKVVGLLNEFWLVFLRFLFI